MIGVRQLEWRTDGERPTLHRLNRKSVLATVEPDATWPGMWRVRRPDGSLTDMANLTRAKDAALSLTLSALNRHVREAGAVGAPVSQNENQVSGVGPGEINAPAALLAEEAA
jgi:hypothetical protein